MLRDPCGPNSSQKRAASAGITYKKGKHVKGLIIDEPWIGLILSGNKTWEMRKTTCHYRGPIALIRKGSSKVVGTAEIVDSLPPIEDASDYARAEPWHRIPPNRQTAAFHDGWRTAWVLRNAQSLADPIAYKHPNGAVIWVNLDDDLRRAVAAQSTQSFKKEVALTRWPTNNKADGVLSAGPVQTDLSRPPEDAVENPTLKSDSRIALHAVVRRGRDPGTILYPHIHADGCYVVSLSRYEKHYIRVRSLDKVKEYLGRGYALRMSNQHGTEHRAPSLIVPDSIIGWR
jgi:hypothetical protein